MKRNGSVDFNGPLYVVIHIEKSRELLEHPKEFYTVE
uniref:Uncharacterized protein n=1 Tax=Dulem virus 42 TaxID=3145760 RepID=A0AAU8B7G0_9CAUD